MPVVGGEEMPFAYGDPQAEVDLINPLPIIEVMTWRMPRGRGVHFRSPPTTSRRISLGQRERHSR